MLHNRQNMYWARNNTEQPKLLLRIQIRARTPKKSSVTADEKSNQNELTTSNDLSLISSDDENNARSELKASEVIIDEEEFSKIFDSGFKIQKENDWEILKQISNITVDAAENLFSYIDTGELHIQSVPIALNMLKAGEKLMMQEVIKNCLLFLLDNIDENNVLCIYRQLKFSNESANMDNFKNELLNKCLSFIDIHAENIIKSKDFVNLEAEIIKDIICRSTLRIPSRSIIIDALNSWANRDCKCCLLLNHCSLLGKSAKCTHSIVIRDAIKTLNNNNSNCGAKSNQSFSEVSSPKNSENFSRSNNLIRKLNKSKMRRSFGDIFWYLIKIFD